MISSTDPTKKLGRVVADSYKTPAVSLIESSQIKKSCRWERRKEKSTEKGKMHCY